MINSCVTYAGEQCQAWTGGPNRSLPHRLTHLFSQTVTAAHLAFDCHQILQCAAIAITGGTIQPALPLIYWLTIATIDYLWFTNKHLDSYIERTFMDLRHLKNFLSEKQKDSFLKNLFFKQSHLLQVLGGCVYLFLGSLTTVMCLRTTIYDPIISSKFVALLLFCKWALNGAGYLMINNSFKSACNVQLSKHQTLDTTNPKDILLVITALSDHNGALIPHQYSPYRALEQDYQLVFRPAGKVSDIIQEAAQIAQHKKIAALWINAHGAPDSLLLNDGESINPITVCQLRPLQNTLHPDATIVLASCSAAGSSQNDNYQAAVRFVQFLVSSPTQPSSEDIANQLRSIKENPHNIATQMANQIQRTVFACSEILVTEIFNSIQIIKTKPLEIKFTNRRDITQKILPE